MPVICRQGVGRRRRKKGEADIELYISISWYLRGNIRGRVRYFMVLVNIPGPPGIGWQGSRERRVQISPSSPLLPFSLFSYFSVYAMSYRFYLYAFLWAFAHLPISSGSKIHKSLPIVNNIGVHMLIFLELFLNYLPQFFFFLVQSFTILDIPKYIYIFFKRNSHEKIFLWV